MRSDGFLFLFFDFIFLKFLKTCLVRNNESSDLTPGQVAAVAYGFISFSPAARIVLLSTHARCDDPHKRSWKSKRGRKNFQATLPKGRGILQDTAVLQ